MVIGIGGSYLGAQAVMDMMSDYFPADKRTQIILPNTLSSSYTARLLDTWKIRTFPERHIKSGTTTGPAMLFRLFRQLLRKKYGKEYYKRVYCATTIGKGPYITWLVKTDIDFFDTGKYRRSLFRFTPVGLLPLAVSGIDIKELIAGAREAAIRHKSAPYPESRP